jgi:hypothetical protein
MEKINKEQRAEFRYLLGLRVGQSTNPDHSEMDLQKWELKIQQEVFKITLREASLMS